MNSWVDVGYVVFSIVTALTWLASFVTTVVAIFIDRIPAEGNLGGLAAVLVIVALVFTFIVAIWSDGR